MAETGVDEYVQRKIIHDCFGGEIERKCSTCPAHHSRPGGICCFGDPEQYGGDDDEDCRKCTFQEECSQDVIEEQAEAQFAQRMKMGWRPPSQRPSSSGYRSSSPPNSRFSTPTSNGRLVQIGGLRREQQQSERRPSVITPPRKLVEREEEENENMWGRFFKDTVWGAGQGAFEMAAEFFRTHRWR